MPPVGGSTLILVYVGLALGCTLCIFIRAMCLTTAGYKTANLLFHKMHLCIFRAPMSFFDATPSGRILNRVSQCSNCVLVVDCKEPLSNSLHLHTGIDRSKCS